MSNWRLSHADKIARPNSGGHIQKHETFFYYICIALPCFVAYAEDRSMYLSTPIIHFSIKPTSRKIYQLMRTRMKLASSS
ncbi:hypothetical protein IHE45_16G077100 [Dioscorea alata]|uniref:Uncharacterized protein n=1 Tax=Dioscorea alata TaxID=55571 RepID=A0ACB7UIB9_DIOAL|nr:hypothetical protein IHE45_16G077100 [Dioscorea alata]